MLDRIISIIALALFDYLAKRMEKGKVAIEADLDWQRLSTAGNRIAQWMREQDRPSS
jgi:hypothetical protein